MVFEECIDQGWAMKKGKPRLARVRVLVSLICACVVMPELIGATGGGIAQAIPIITLAAPVSGTVVGITTNLRVRNGPGLTYAVTNYLVNGTKMTITGYTSDGWLRMKTSSIALGYVSADYVNIPVVSVSMARTSASVVVGSVTPTSYEIFPACATNLAVTFTSSSTAVATVGSTSGRVTAMAIGSTTVTVRTTDGGKTASMTYSVVPEAAAVPVTGVRLNKQTSLLTVGAAEQLVATVQPSNATDQSISWRSNDGGVVSVNARTGLVTAVRAGVAIVMVVTGDGQKTDICTYTVVNAGTVAATSVSLNKSTSSLKVGASETLAATVLPKTATNTQVTWTSSMPSVATVDRVTGKVTAVMAGSTTITAKTVDGGKTASCSYSITGIASTSTLKIADNTVIPNPMVAGTSVTVKGTVTSSQNLTNVTAQIRTTAGILKYGPFSTTPTGKSYNLANLNAKLLFSKLSAGTYEYVVTAKDVSGNQKSMLKAFTVQACLLTTSGLMKVPTSITKGTGLSVVGTLKITGTGCKITKVTATITTSKYSASGTPNATSFSLKTLDSALKFKELGAGNYTFTVSVLDSKGKTWTPINKAPLQVKGPVAVTGVGINTNCKQLSLGSNYSFSANVIPTNATNQKVTWASSDKSVLSITSGGLATTVSQGNATISATSVDGGKKASIYCSVYVTGLTRTSPTSFIKDSAGNASTYLGDSLKVTDIIWSNRTITSVLVGIEQVTPNTNSWSWLSGYTASTKANDFLGLKYPVGTIADQVLFKNLPVGRYRLRIDAKDNGGGNKSWTQEFNIVKQIKGASYAGCRPYSTAKSNDDQFPVPPSAKGGKTADSIVAIAVSQIGYHEGTYCKTNTTKGYNDCVIFPTDGNWTKYYSSGTPFSAGTGATPWCVIFTVWTLKQAGINPPALSIGGRSFYTAYLDAKKWKYGGPNVVPKPGDTIIFADKIGNKPIEWSWYHTGLVEFVANGKVHTIEGNAGSGVVKRNVYDLGSKSIGGYGSNT